jgi:purine-binding chemotaxis protein CheW
MDATYCSLVVFTLDGTQAFAVQRDAVTRVVRAVAVRPLPQAPPVVLGVINASGNVIAVVSLRRRLGLPERDIEPSDQILLVRTPRRELGLLVDHVTGVMEIPESDCISGEAIVPGLEHVRGVAKLDGDVVYIHDIDACLSLEEEALLDQALTSGA